MTSHMQQACLNCEYDRSYMTTVVECVSMIGHTGQLLVKCVSMIDHSGQAH